MVYGTCYCSVNLGHANSKGLTIAMVDSTRYATARAVAIAARPTENAAATAATGHTPASPLS